MEFWYGQDFRHHGPADLFRLEAALPGLLAERQLYDKGERAFHPDDLYELVMRATGSAELAEAAAVRRRTQIMNEIDERAQP